MPTLQALIAAGHEIALVVSQPDRPVGRSQQLTRASREADGTGGGAANYAAREDQEQCGISRAARSHCAGCHCGGGVWAHHSAVDAGLPRLGCINLHASLLPKYRGAAPIQWAVAMGETVTGNTTMLLEEGLDTGPILLQQEIAIAPGQTAADLFDVLAKAGAPLVVKTLAGLDDGTITPKAAGSLAGDACADPDARRRADGFCEVHGAGVVESVAGISAMAGGLLPRWEEADRAPDAGGASKDGPAREPGLVEVAHGRDARGVRAGDVARDCGAAA